MGVLEHNWFGGVLVAASRGRGVLSRRPMPRWMMPGKRLLWKWFMMGPSLSEPEAGLLCGCPDSAVVAEQQLAEQPSVPCPNPDCKQLNAKENVTCAFCDEPLQVRLRERGGAGAGP